MAAMILLALAVHLKGFGIWFVSETKRLIAAWRSTTDRNIPCFNRRLTAPAWTYFTTDHLGSIAAATDGSGTVVERDAYDPWGRRRNLNGADDAACSLASLTSRGYTGHEHIDAICEINANARIYDPTIGRFMSADSVVPDVFDGQSFNRYSYVLGNPLAFIDPSGHIDTVTVTAPRHHDAGGSGYSGPTTPSALGSADVERIETVVVACPHCSPPPTITPTAKPPTIVLVLPPSRLPSLVSGSDDGDTNGGMCRAPTSPPGANVNKNIQTGRDIRTAAQITDAVTLSPLGDVADLGALYFMFRNKGPYDYKQAGRQYDDFGNFNYGAMGSAMGFSDQVLLRGAGWAQMRSGNYDPSFGKWWGGPPYGDDPADQTQIKNGINYYRNCNG